MDITGVRTATQKLGDFPLIHVSPHLQKLSHRQMPLRQI